MCEIAQGLGVSCTEEQARAHFSKHHPEQPAVSGPIDRTMLLAEANALPHVYREVVETVFRQRFLSTAQVREMFFEEHYSQESAAAMTRECLTSLSRQRFLYRIWCDGKHGRPGGPSPVRDPGKQTGRNAKPGNPENMARGSLWFLGKNAVPLIEERYGITLRPGQYIQMAKEVSSRMIPHDARLSELYLSLLRGLRKRGGWLTLTDGRRSQGGLLYANWFGTKQLTFGFYDAIGHSPRELTADAFATVSLSRSGYSDDDLPSCQLPFFLEYDRGSRIYSEVLDQLYSYHLMALSGVATRRFPELAVDGYVLPVIAVFSSRTRVEGAHLRFNAMAREQRQRTGSPIFLVSEEDWLGDPFAPGIIRSAWNRFDDRYDLIEVLRKSSRRLIEARALFADQPLTLNPKGAHKLSGGSRASEGLAISKARLAEKNAEVRKLKERAEITAGKRSLALPAARG